MTSSSTSTLERPLGRPMAPAEAGSGGVAARRAVMRWAWRLFRREWRQQFLILSLIVVATAAVIVGAATSTNFGAGQELRLRFGALLGHVHRQQSHRHALDPLEP